MGQTVLQPLENRRTRSQFLFIGKLNTSGIPLYQEKVVPTLLHYPANQQFKQWTRRGNFAPFGRFGETLRRFFLVFYLLIY